MAFFIRMPGLSVLLPVLRDMTAAGIQARQTIDWNNLKFC